MILPLLILHAIIFMDVSAQFARDDGDEDGFRLWQSLTRQTELMAQLGSIMKDVKQVRGSAQKKIDGLRQLLSGVFSELTNFDEVQLISSLMCCLSPVFQC